MTEAPQVPSSPGAPFTARCGATELRPVRRADAEPLFSQIHGHPGVIRWLSWAGPARVEELEDRYATWRTGAADDPICVYAM